MSGVDKKIPREGMDRETLIGQMQALRGGDINWHDNRAFSLVFHQTDEHTDFLKRVYGTFFSENGLNPMAFKSLRQFEHDVVRMTVNLFHGDRDAVGTMTSGGTESIMLAIKTYRDRARKLQPRIKRPEVIVPRTVHVAFPKACKYFDVKMVVAPLGEDGKVDIAEVARLINRNTIALVGSAPNYPNGQIDDIEALGQLALTHEIGLHVDACIGGFFLPWAERLGHPIPPWDYRVPGVTSISADLHKYGYAAKGASTITYRSMDYLRHQFFVYVDWPGGVFASPSLPGTRPGGSIAAAWAALQAMGENGYMENAAVVMDTAKRFIDGITVIPELEVIGQPPVGILAYRSKSARVNIYAVADRLETHGWHIDRQQKPASLHFMINPGHAKIVDQYLDDLGEAVEYVKRHPEAAGAGSAPMYGLIAGAPLRGMVADNVLAMMEQMYGPEGAAPNLKSNGKGGGVPRPVLWAMNLRSRIASLFRL
jgi:glutamate/tyrosine decarboxylase-like PLP-dependent enzyme